MAAVASHVLRIAVCGALLLALGAGTAGAQQKVGISSAVNPQATGTPPGGVARQIVIGQNVVYNERITTTSAGQTQLLFLDESSMSVGPNSDLTIDQFVYNPKAGTGKLAMSATRGILRYVGGKLSKQNQGVTLRTSTATLAVRGGAFIAKIAPDGTTDAVFLYGKELQITALAGGSVTLTRPGFQSTVARGGHPSAPSEAPAGLLAQAVQQLDGRTGGDGGAPVIPTETTVVSSGVSQAISGNLAVSVQQATQTQVATAAPSGQTTPATSPSMISPISPPQLQQQVNGPSQVVTCTASGVNSCGPTTQVGTTGSGIPVGGTPLPPVNIRYGGRVKNTNGGGTARGFVDQSPGGDIAYADGTLSYPSGLPQQGIFTGTFGSLGTITFPLVPGSSSFGPQGTSSVLGTFSGTSFLSADNTFFYATIVPTRQPTERLVIFGGTPANASAYAQTGTTRIFAFSVQPDGALQSAMPFIRSQAGGNLATAAASPFYVVAPPLTAIGDRSTSAAARGLQASLAVNGQGLNQQSAIAVTAGDIATLQSSGQPAFTGRLRGSSMMSAIGKPVAIASAVDSTVDGNGNSLYGGSAIAGFVLDQTAYGSGSNGTIGSAVIPSTASETPLSGTPTTYGFAQPVVPIAMPSGVGSSRTTQALTGNFGGLVYSNVQGNPYIATGSALLITDAANNRVQATLGGTARSPSSGVTALAMQFGDLIGGTGGQAFVDDNTFAATESQTNKQQITIDGTVSQPTGKLYIVSSGAAGEPASLLPSGVSYCQCQYLKWGYWGGDLTSASATAPGGFRIDRGHINTWVAGVQTPLNDLDSLISQSATATYTGHAIGSVFNNGASYLAAGGFTGKYNFGTQTGTMTVSNFDGHNFTASGAAPLSGASYAFSTNATGVKGTINGAFYGPNAAETGGNFAFQTTAGPTYMASGIFAGKK